MFLDQMAEETKLGLRFLRRTANGADYLYRKYEIPKKTGGLRTIEHPAKKLKVLQRWIAKNYISQFPVHPSAVAYRDGLSIRNNAQRHAFNHYLLKLDFQDFFHSLKGWDVERLFKLNLSRIHPALDEEEIFLIRKILCRYDRLTIGAPSSPILSNALMYEFDTYWADKCAHLGVSYTRYADDVVFSTSVPNVLYGISLELQNAELHPGNLKLQINKSKSVFSSRKHRKIVTGLFITPVGKVSLGRKRKREIRTLVFAAVCGSLELDRLEYLRGMLAFANSAEPEFLNALERKFGRLSVAKLMGREPPTDVA
jgi:retron-type reverse transcriptase